MLIQQVLTRQTASACHDIVVINAAAVSQDQHVGLPTADHADQDVGLPTADRAGSFNANVVARGRKGATNLKRFCIKPMHLTFATDGN